MLGDCGFGTRSRREYGAWQHILGKEVSLAALSSPAGLHDPQSWAWNTLMNPVPGVAPIPLWV